MPRKSFLKNLDKELQHSIPPSARSRTVTEGDIHVDFKFDTTRMKILKSRGVDGYAFSLARSPFSLEDSLVRIKPSVKWLPEDFVLRSISIKKQLTNIEKVFAKPLTGSYTCAIGSYPSDTRAKVLALNIMNRAIDAQIDGAARGRSYPMWHRLMGNTWDPIRDSRDPDPFSMLIITNVGVDSSQIKLEKLRDLLEKYDSIPKIVVVNGIDPVTFFAERVRLPLNYAFHLTAEHKASILDI